MKILKKLTNRIWSDKFNYSNKSINRESRKCKVKKMKRHKNWNNNYKGNILRLKSYKMRKIEWERKLKSIEKCRNKCKTNYWKKFRLRKWSSKRYCRKSKGSRKIESNNKPSKNYKRLTWSYYKECSRYQF